MNIARRFAGRAGYALALRVAWAVISFAGAALLARWFSAGDYGRYAAVISLVTFLAVVCALGAPNALIRLLGEYGAREEPGLAHGVSRTARGAALAASLGAAVLLAAGAVVLHLAGIVPAPLVYVAGALILPAFTMAEVQGAAARSHGRIFAALAPRDVLWRLLLIPLAWVAATWLAPDRQLLVFLLAAAAGLTALVLGQAWALRRATPPAIRAAAPVYRLGEWAKITASTWVTQVANVVFRTMDVVIAGIFLAPREVGLYFAASRVAALISFVLTSTSMILGPEVARLHHAGAQAQLRRMLRWASVMVFAPSLAIFLVCVVFADQVLGLFGEGFAAARTELIVLAVGQLFNAAAGCVGLVLMMTGLERKNAQVLVSTSAATVAAMALLTLLYGTLGTALATSGGLVVWNLRLWLVARRHTAYDPSILGLFRLA